MEIDDNRLVGLFSSMSDWIHRLINWIFHFYISGTSWPRFCGRPFLVQLVFHPNSTQYALCFRSKHFIIDKYYVKVPKAGIICLISTITILVTIAASKLSRSLDKVESCPGKLSHKAEWASLPSKRLALYLKTEDQRVMHISFGITPSALEDSDASLACFRVSWYPSANNNFTRTTCR